MGGVGKHADDECGHEVFLFRVAHRDHQSDRGKRVVRDSRHAVGIVEGVVAGQEMHEQGGRAALVAVGERMVFDVEVEKVGSLRLHRRVELDPAEALVSGLFTLRSEPPRSAPNSTSAGNSAPTPSMTVRASS
jgi:hypothetical protein